MQGGAAAPSSHLVWSLQISDSDGILSIEIPEFAVMITRVERADTHREYASRLDQVSADFGMDN